MNISPTIVNRSSVVDTLCDVNEKASQSLIIIPNLDSFDEYLLFTNAKKKFSHQPESYHTSGISYILFYLINNMHRKFLFLIYVMILKVFSKEPLKNFFLFIFTLLVVLVPLTRQKQQLIAANS